MRYIGPKWRINRRENASVLGSTDKWKKRPSLPGQFPVLKKRPSDYAYQFREKQKVKRMFGMNETQFVRFYGLALKSPGNTSTRLVQLLELRADNVLYRLGFAQTRAQARQLITHGHVLLNGKKHNIPSTILKPGDEIMFNEKFQKSPLYNFLSQVGKANKDLTWIDRLSSGGKVVAEPTRDEMESSIKERLIIELYSR
jgi:small subunit ribosomal protein S4